MYVYVYEKMYVKNCMRMSPFLGGTIGQAKRGRDRGCQLIVAVVDQSRAPPVLNVGVVGFEPGRSLKSLRRLSSRSIGGSHQGKRKPAGGAAKPKQSHTSRKRSNLNNERPLLKWCITLSGSRRMAASNASTVGRTAWEAKHHHAVLKNLCECWIKRGVTFVCFQTPAF